MLDYKTIITIILLAIEFSFAGGRNNKDVVSREQTTIQEVDTTKLEKYKKRVIVKAKVGSGSGEIGVVGGGSIEGPKGIAVDGGGNIFLLDNINKRIVKFSNEGKYISNVNLPGIETYQEGLENHLLVDEDGNFYIKTAIVKLGESGICKYKYNKDGLLLASGIEIPNALQNLRNKVVTGDIIKYTILNAAHDTIIQYYVTDSLKNSTCTLKIKLPACKNWKYSITPHSFLGFDRNGAAYIHITFWKDIPTWHMDESQNNRIRDEIQIVYKFNNQGEVTAIIKEKTPGIGFEIWNLTEDGALYLLKYAFKDVITNELPDWVKNDSTMTEEQKNEWRREYMAPEGYVYVIKFSKVEEK